MISKAKGRRFIPTEFYVINLETDDRIAALIPELISKRPSGTLLAVCFLEHTPSRVHCVMVNSPCQCCQVRWGLGAGAGIWLIQWGKFSGLKLGTSWGAVMSLAILNAGS